MSGTAEVEDLTFDDDDEDDNPKPKLPSAIPPAMPFGRSIWDFLILLPESPNDFASASKSNIQTFNHADSVSAFRASDFDEGE